MIENDLQRGNTGWKLNELSERIRLANAARARGVSSPLDDLTLLSLNRLANQLSEEITRFDAAQRDTPESALPLPE